MFPQTVAPGITEYIPPIDETVYVTADFTGMGSVWEDEGGATTNLFDSLDDANDATYIELQLVIPGTVICGTSTESHNYRGHLDAPSATPSPDQTVEVVVKMEYLDLFSATGESHDLDIELIEGASTVIASSLGNSLTETPVEYVLSLTKAQIVSVGDWSDLDVRATIVSCAGDSVPNADDQNLRIMEIRVDFTPP